jgi:hypothetical protein
MNTPGDTYKDWIMNDISNQLIKKLDDYIIEGLKRKGYEFNNRIELENFINVWFMETHKSLVCGMK